MGVLYSGPAESQPAKALKVPDRTVAAAKVLADIHDKSQSEVKDHRGTEGQKGCIDEEKAYAGGGNAQLFPQGGANPKRMILKKLAYPFHLFTWSKPSLPQ